MPKQNKSSNQRSAAWFFKTFFVLIVVGSLFGGAAVAGVFWQFSHDLPNIITVADYRPNIVTRVIATGPDQSPEAIAKNSKVIGEFREMRRYLVPYDKIPDVVVRAFTSAEDDKFFEHPGINIVSMVRAGIANFRAGHVVQGGSTITQQVAKSLLLSPERSFGRKIKEVILAYRIEKNLTKQQILYLYLNEIYLGQNSYGVEAACQTYFRKPIAKISLAEAAILAGMPQAPSKYSPVVSPKKAKERQTYVLHRMKENGYISEAQMRAALVEPVRIFHDDDSNYKPAAYLVEQIRRYLMDKYGADAVYKQGLTVLTPTTAELSLSASRSVKDGLDAVDKRIGYRGPIKHLASAADIEKFTKDTRLKLIDRKLEYQVLTPEGALSPVAAMQLAKIDSDIDLLTVGEKYEGIITNVDDRAKTAEVTLGNVKALLPFDKMKWARLAKDEKNPGLARPEPRMPSMVVRSGDVVQVKILAAGKDRGVIVGLDQEPQVQGALLSLEAKTGYVLAMQGGYEYSAKSQFNRTIQALRQPGSSFKPLIYAAAIEKGYTPASIIVDSPIVYNLEEGKWRPSNFEEKFYGDTTFRQALIHSRNVPTIKIVQSLQIPTVIDYVRRIGMIAQLNPDLSISLGNAGVSLFENTKAYALFPRLGRKVSPIFITKVMDRDGKVLEEQKPQPPAASDHLPEIAAVAAPTGATPEAQPQPVQQVKPLVPQNSLGRVHVDLPTYPLANDPEQVMDPRVAYVMTHLMKEVVTYGTGHEATNLQRPAAGKTGTTNDYVDAWFMGFTPHVVTGAWVGFDNSKQIGHLETGARAALPIWLGFMKDAVQPYPGDDFPVPPGVVFASIDQNSGKLAPPNSLRAIREAFIEGTEPKETADKSSSGAAPSTSDFFKEDLE